MPSYFMACSWRPEQSLRIWISLRNTRLVSNDFNGPFFWIFMRWSRQGHRDRKRDWNVGLYCRSTKWPTNHERRWKHASGLLTSIVVYRFVFLDFKYNIETDKIAFYRFPLLRERGKKDGQSRIGTTKDHSLKLGPESVASLSISLHARASQCPTQPR